MANLIAGATAERDDPRVTGPVPSRRRRGAIAAQVSFGPPTTGRRAVSIDVRPRLLQHAGSGNGAARVGVADTEARVWTPQDQPWSTSSRGHRLRADYRRLGDVSAVLDRDRRRRWHVSITTLLPGSWTVDETVPVVDLGGFHSLEAARAAADARLEQSGNPVTGESGCTCTVLARGTKRQASLLDPECPVHRNREGKPRRRHLVPLGAARP